MSSRLDKLRADTLDAIERRHRGCLTDETMTCPSIGEHCLIEELRQLRVRLQILQFQRDMWEKEAQMFRGLAERLDPSIAITSDV